MSLIDFELEKKISSNSIIFSKNLPLYRKRSLQLAKALITSDGQLNLEVVVSLKNSLPLVTEHDAHILSILNKMLSDQSFAKKITRFDLPITEEFEQLVCSSLDLTLEPVSKVTVRQAALGALFSYLRQTVGSCFSTAPCLYILKKHPDYFLDDLYLLSKKNCLERFSYGHLIQVPMALSIGQHFLETPVQLSHLDDSVFAYFKEKLKEPLTLVPQKTFKECLGTQNSLKLYTYAHDPIIKIWEYTMASFCDARGEFSESTLYLTLGLDHQMPEGLGEFFYNTFQKQLDHKHELLLQAQDEAYLAHQRLVMAEGMAKNASTESSFQRSKSELAAAHYQLHSRQLDLDEAKKEEEKIKNLYEKKIELLKQSIPQFFQESYDPDLVDMKSYSDDAPAGFRLFIKEGQLSSRFKPIKTEDEFVQALKKFFEKIETELLIDTRDKDQEAVITHVITETIQFSSSKRFLEKTYSRAKKRHPKALPWAYVSGGTLETLLKTYFRKEILKIHKIQGDTLLQFFVQLIDYFKSLPENHLAPFRQDRTSTLLLETKSHACQLTPGSPFFASFWDSSGFTYTDARDKLLEAGRTYYSSKLHQTLSTEELRSLGKNIPSQSLHSLLQTHPQKKEALFFATSYLIAHIPSHLQQQTCGFCKIGDTNWIYDAFIIGYNPLTDNLSLFAQDPDSKGLLHLEHMETFPLEWKIYEDLSRVELFVQGLKI